MYKLKKQYRLPGYDYSQDGCYFITIVTKNRKHYFGEINEGQMVLSAAGQQAKENILKFYCDETLANPHQNNPYYLNNSDYVIAINEFEIMPNHVHLIVEIMNKTPAIVGTRLEACAHNGGDGLHPLIIGSISSFINHFKGKIKRWCGENNLPEFAWQSRFHDRIIRDMDEYNRIARYIRKNVENWKGDNEFLP